MANFFNSMVNLTGIGSLLASPTNHDKKKMDTDSGSEYQQPSADSESSSSEEDYKQFMCSSTSASVATKSRKKSRKKSLVDLTLTSPTPVSAVSNDLENPESLAQTFLETNRVAKKNRNKTWGKRGIDKPGRKKAVQNNSDEGNGKSKRKSNGKSNGKGDEKGDEKGDAKSADDDNCNSNTEEGKIGLSVSYTHTHTLHTHTFRSHKVPAEPMDRTGKFQRRGPQDGPRHRPIGQEKTTLQTTGERKTRKKDNVDNVQILFVRNGDCPDDRTQLSPTGDSPGQVERTRPSQRC